MNSKSVADYTVNLIASVFLSFSMVLALTSSLMFTTNAFTILILIAVFTASFSLIFKNWLSAVIAFFILIILTVVLSDKFSFSEAYGEIEQYILWIYNYTQHADFLVKEYQAATVFLLSFSFSLLVFIFTFKKFNFFVLLTAGISIFVSQWMLNFFVSYLSFYLYLAFMLMYYLKYIYIRKSKMLSHESVNQGAFMTGISLFCAFTIAISVSIPHKATPIEWKWLDTKINSAFNYFNQLSNSNTFEFFSLKSTGFGQNNNLLGGRVSLDKTPVLKVESPRSIYLRGVARDIYTGSAWLSSNKDTQFIFEDNSDYSKINSDLMETALGVTLFSGGNFSDDTMRLFFFDDTVKVTYQNIKTKSLFVPLKSLSLNINYDLVEKLNVDFYDIFTSQNLLKNNISYSMNVFNVKYYDRKFTDLLRNSQKGLLQEIMDTHTVKVSVPDEDQQGESVIIHQRVPRELISLLRRAQHNSDNAYNTFLQLPNSLPPRVSELAASISANSVNNYDKVKSIERYLSQSYPYTLNPEPTPRNRDFVDYFLFDLKQGYCTYYASAMAVMVRSLGIPARYVEGYMMPSQKEEDGSYTVTNQQAHAWVEVYFEGFGWIPFEPTSPFVSNFYINSGSTANISSDFADDPYYLEYLRQLEGYNQANMYIDPSLYNRTVSGSDTAFKTFIVTSIIIGVVAFILLFILFLQWIRRKMRAISLKKASPKEAVLSAIRHYVKILSLQGYKIHPGETPEEYSKRMSDYLLYDSYWGNDENSPVISYSKTNDNKRKSGFDRVMDIFILARYSSQEISENQKQFVLGYYDILLKRTRGNLGAFKYFIFYKLLGKI